MISIIKSKVKSKLQNYIKSEIENEVQSQLLQKDFIQIFTQLQQFNSAPDEMLSSRVEALTDIKNLVDRFEQLGVKIVRERIDFDDFDLWIENYPEMREFYYHLGDVKIEKLLEHYLTTKYLNISGEVVYIDIAAASSPFAEIISKHVGCQAYSQDLIFDEGIHGNKIGGDAGNMPVPDNFADVMTLHCAYECFQGDSDIRFIKDAGRVLKINGRLGIIPLYIDDVYFVKTGPKYDKSKVKVEHEARWIWRDDQWDSEPFSRHYSPESFKGRIIDNSSGLECELIHFTNLEELRSKYTGQRIYCNFMLRAKK